jgi:glycosyltransferase involved in cell wall biosynthesis
MNTKSLVSIIIPVYNTQRYLAECVRSVRNQTYKNIEIILVDDGSADGSEKMCDQYEKEDDRVHVIHSKNFGVSHARNLGLHSAQGEYLFFFDSDDWIDDNCIEYLMKLYERYDADLVSTNATWEFTRGSQTKAGEKARCFSFDEIVELLSEYRNNISLHNSLYRGDIIKKYRIEFDENLSIGEDFEFTYKYIRYSDSVCWDASYFGAHYRVRKGSAMHSEFSEKNLGGMTVFDKIISLYEDYHDFVKYMQIQKIEAAIYLKYRYLKSKETNSGIRKIIDEAIRTEYADYMKCKDVGIIKKVYCFSARYCPLIMLTMKDIKCVADKRRD